jgi:LytS/YehU family sensor histidine kinase
MSRNIRAGLSRDYMISVVVVLSSQLIHISQKQQKTLLENEALHTEYMRSRYEALKNQVDPHFLFNSLNTLNSLIKVDADKAQEYVQQLSFVFRYTLQNAEVITLSEELKFTKAYCHLMKIRYGNNLNFEYNVDEKLYDYLIIPLSLQTLVENAIKHNVVSTKQPLTVKIDGVEDSITVSNPIQLKKEAESGEKIGLVNLAERYKLMWKKEITAIKTEKSFEVTVPLMRS